MQEMSQGIGGIVDFILEKLIHDVEEWYDLHFYSLGYRYKKLKKHLHIDMLKQHYTPSDFEGKFGGELHEARVEYLTRLQTMVDKALGGG